MIYSLMCHACLTIIQLYYIKIVIYFFQPFKDPISLEIMMSIGNLQRLTMEVCENACNYYKCSSCLQYMNYCLIDNPIGSKTN